MSDERVLAAVMDAGRQTRAELAARTGLSKPTVSESVRRLTEADVLCDTGERTTGRGRSGLYYALAPSVGHALVVSIAPGLAVAETVDAYGTVANRATELIGRPARPAEVERAMVHAAETVTAGKPVRLAVVSAADPVERATGRLVQLPDAPFLLGELSPVDALSGLVSGPVTVDNDVNWAARAERETRDRAEADDFLYLYLGEGLGMAIVSDGEVRRGHVGFAGEIAHVLTSGPGGQSTTFTEVFQTLALRLPGSTAVDVAALLAVVRRTDAPARRIRRDIGRAVAGILSGAVAMVDPALIVIGGPWGGEPTVLEDIDEELRALARHAPLEAARSATDAPHVGARMTAVANLRAAITAGTAS